MNTEFDVDADINGYVLDHITKNDVPVEHLTTHYVVENTNDIDLKLYYKKRLSIRAHSKQDQWKEIYATEGLAESNYDYNSNELKEGHTLTSVTITGELKETGVIPNVPSDAKITKSGSDEEFDAETFYSINYVNGTLTLTPAYVTITVDPDRWIGDTNVYDGTEYKAGFTNENKTQEDYVKISHDDYKAKYLDQIWNQLTLNNTDEGKTLISKTDAGLYTESANNFKGRINLPDDKNYVTTLFVRDCQLEIKPAQLKVATGSDQKVYDGSALTKDDLTLSLGDDECAHDGETYTLIGGDSISVRVTGSQTNAGTSNNSYEIQWNNAKADNYLILEDLGTLEVTPKRVTIKANNVEIPVGLNIPPFTVTVTETDGGAVIPNTSARWDGNNYTVRLQDNRYPNLADIPLIISSAGSQEVGSCPITIAKATGEQSNYEIEVEDGTLTVAIARVTNDNGETWSYHTNLVNPVRLPEIEEGAFDKAYRTTGNVIVETLVENHSRYTLVGTESNPAFRFDTNSKPSSIEIRTTRKDEWNPVTPGGAKFKSIIKRGYTGPTMIEINKSGLAVAIKELVFDGCGTIQAGSPTYQSTAEIITGGDGKINNMYNGGAIKVKTAQSFLLQKAEIKNCTAQEGNGGGLYVGQNVQNTSVNDVVFNHCVIEDVNGRKQHNSGGGAFIYNKAEVNSVTVTDCYARGDKGGGIYFQNTQSSLGVQYKDVDNENKLTPPKASVFENCSATAGGGVSFFKDGSKVPRIEGVAGCPITFINCEAFAGRGNGCGGAVNFSGSGSISNCIITDNTAIKGGGVYVTDSITLNNVKVQNNKLSTNTAADAAGVFVEKGTLNLGDGTQAAETTQVTGNKTKNGTNSNVRLIENSNKTENANNSVRIQSPLAASCKINVVNAKKALTRFGNIAPEVTDRDTITYNSRSFVKIFEADDGVLFGCVDPDDANKVYWFGIVCKITDASGKTLTYDGNKDAVFPGLREAFNVYESTRLNGSPRNIEMLIDNYTMGSDGIIRAQDFTLEGAGQKRAVILKTAAQKATDGKYDYMGKNRPAVIAKRSEGVDTLFTVPKDYALTITDIVIDGMDYNISNTAGVESSIANVSGALTLDNGAVLRNGMAQRNNDNARAGAVYVNENGLFTMKGTSVIDGCVGRSSGAVYVGQNAQFTMDENAIIRNCKAQKVGNSLGGSGGAVTLGRKGVGGTFTQTGNSVIQNCTAGEMGGAVYVEDGTYNLSGSAAIKGCTAKTGAAIYLNAQNNNKDRATLKLSGSPQFGDGSEGDSANTVSVSNYASQKNGGEEVYADDKARQDIYLAGYENKNASPIQVTGKLTSGPGTIWVWAEKNPHHKKLEQFAQFVDGGTNLGDADKSTSMTAFRNARHDEETGCTGAYLTGQAGTGELIIWSGGFDFTFLKTTGYGDRLNNATFELYQANASRSDIPANATAYQTAESRQLATTNPAAVKVVVNNAVQEKGVAGDGLVTFEKVPTGTWFIKETIFPKVDSTNTDQNAARYFDQYKDTNKTNIQNEYRYVVMRRVTVNANGTIKMEYAETDKEGRAVLDAQNNLKWKDVPTTKLSVVNGVQDETVPVYTFMNVSPFQRKVILRKVGEDNGKYVTPSGAKFRIYGADWREIVDQEYESDAKTGAYFVDTLPYGVYYLVETQFPTGYQPTGHDAYDATKPETWPYYKLTVGDAGQTIKNAKNEDVTIDARGTYIEGLFWGVDATVPEDTSSDTPQEPQGQEFNPTTGNPEDYSAMWGKIYLTSGTHRGEAFSFGTHSGRVTFEYGNTTYTGMKAYEWYLLSELNDDELNQVREAVDTNDLQNQGWRIDKATTIWYEGNDQYAKGFYVTLHDWNHGSLNNLNELFNSEHVVYLGNGYDVYDYNTLPLRYTAPGIPPQQGTKALIYTAEKDGKRHFWLRTNTEGGYTVHSDSQMNSDRSLDANGIPNNSQKWLDITDWVS